MSRLWRLSGPATDEWRHLEDEVPLGDGKQTISWSRWTALNDEVQNKLKWLGVGVRVPQQLSIQELGPVAQAFEIIVVTVEEFEDGRHFSLVRELRDSYAFQGAIRASGHLLLDQLIQAIRCGYDEFALASVYTDAKISLALGRYPHHYQSDVRGGSSIRAARTAAAGGE